MLKTEKKPSIRFAKSNTADIFYFFFLICSLPNYDLNFQEMTSWEF